MDETAQERTLTGGDKVACNKLEHFIKQNDRQGHVYYRPPLNSIQWGDLEHGLCNDKNKQTKIRQLENSGQMRGEKTRVEQRKDKTKKPEEQSRHKKSKELVDLQLSPD